MAAVQDSVRFLDSAGHSSDVSQRYSHLDLERSVWQPGQRSPQLAETQPWGDWLRHPALISVRDHCLALEPILNSSKICFASWCLAVNSESMSKKLAVVT